MNTPASRRVVDAWHVRTCSTLHAFAAILAIASLSACGSASRNAAAPSGTIGDCAQLAGLRLADDTALVARADPGNGDSDATGCHVELTFPGSELRAEVRLPASAAWNGNLLFLGGGGYDGIVPTADMPQFSPSARTGGYATAATNGGYDHPARDLGYFQAGFARDERKFEDFTHASEHRALPAVIAVMEAFYGQPPRRRYFEGCSMGGHDALILAQRYPGDFDGIVARAPAGNILGLMLQFHRIATLASQPGAALTDRQLERLQATVLEHCDVDDGLRDGIVSRPLECRPDFSALRCPADAQAADCLSDVQFRLVEAVTTPLEAGPWRHPGYPPSGVENDPKGWREYVLPQAAFGGMSLQKLFSDGFLRSFVTGDDNLDTSTWRTEDWLDRLDIVGRAFQADDADLSAFHARGGRLILWNGTADTSVSVSDTVRYYQGVVGMIGEQRARESVELFLAAGVGHCYGGPGADRIDLVQALSDWVETGTAPSRQGLVHHRLDEAGVPALSRPACAWPAYPHYEAGDPSEAASFSCRTP